MSLHKDDHTSYLKCDGDSFIVTSKNEDAAHFFITKFKIGFAIAYQAYENGPLQYFTYTRNTLCVGNKDAKKHFFLREKNRKGQYTIDIKDWKSNCYLIKAIGINGKFWGLDYNNMLLLKKSEDEGTEFKLDASLGNAGGSNIIS